MAVDLFDRKHAENVLICFGQAFDRLPTDRSQLSRDQSRFLSQALSALQRDGTVSPIRLSLFAEMMKGDPWEPSTLQRVGGADGLGVTFLNRFFSSPQSLPSNELHADAARNVLRYLLPDSGIDIRGHVRSDQELLACSGYQDQPARFKQLMEILDQQLRLVTPTESRTADSPREAKERRQKSDAKPQYFQVTHDFMLAPIRQWVTQQQRETIRGRAELCLAERASLWKAKPENRQLPGLLEWLRIRLFTDSTQWTALQRSMLGRATRRSLTQIVAVAACLLMVGIFAWYTRGRIRAESMLTTVRRADMDDLLDVIHDVQPVRYWLAPILEEELKQEHVPVRDRCNMSLTLLGDRPGQADFLYRQLFDLDAHEHRVIRDGISLYGSPAAKNKLTDMLWNVLRDSSVGNDGRIRAASALARLDAGSPNWDQCADDLVTCLVTNPISEVSDWLNNLRPLRGHLLDSLEQVFFTSNSNAGQQSAAFALAFFLRDEKDYGRVINLIKQAHPGQIPTLVGPLRQHGNPAFASLRSECDTDYSEYLDRLAPTSAELPKSIIERLQHAKGLLTKRFALCQALPIKDVPDTVVTLLKHRYCPVRLRPYRSGDTILVAGIWRRSLHDAKVEVAISPDDFTQRDAAMREGDFGIQDLAAYYHDQKWKFVAVWTNAPETLLPTQISSLLPLNKWDADFHQRMGNGYQPFSFQHAPGTNDRDVLRTQIWRRPPVLTAITQWSTNSVEAFLNRSGSYLPRDASLHAGYRIRPIGAIYERDVHLDNKSLLCESPDELLAQWSTEIKKGMIPSVISVSDHASRQAPRSLTVWRYGETDSLIDFVNARSNMITSLLLLEEIERALPFFMHTSDPTLRNSLIENVAQARIPFRSVSAVIENPSVEPDVKQAMILALGAYPNEAILPEDRPKLVAMLREVFHADPDAGVHSASEWAMKSWNVTPGKAKRELLNIHRSWHVTPGGQTMVVLDYPQDYAALSSTVPPPEHRFAIATTEVTIEAFARCFPDHRIDPNHTPANTCPANNMDWYRAAEYCNLLSRKEGLPESEWCYEKNQDGDDTTGMFVPPDFLKRQGYRLPLAAEWLYAASAGVSTPFSYGRGGDELISKYGWMATNSQGILHSVGTLQPNLFGMFDMYGNVKEWAHSLNIPSAEHGRVTNEGQRCVLGGCFVHFSRHVAGNYAKHGNLPDLQENRNGFRIARTILPDSMDE